jgi:uncharacterized protein (DUF1501 family)
LDATVVLHGRALAAFAADLGPAGMSGVTLLTLSEFGRRVAENGSRGADHGYGNAMLLLGGGVKGGKVYGTWVYGTWPDLDAMALWQRFHGWRRPTTVTYHP